MSVWMPISTAPEGQVVRTRVREGVAVRNEQELLRKGRLWFTPDGTMYVYYTPTEWRPRAPTPEDW